MKPALLASLLGLCLLAACEDRSVFDDAADDGTLRVFAEESDSFGLAAAPEPARARPEAQDAAVDEPLTGGDRLIAYSYTYQFETPAASTPGLIDSHREACLSAGPEVCQIVNADIRERGDAGVSGTLSMRAIPTWIDGFRSGLAGQLDSADGRIRHQSQSADDLTATIVDLEARLLAKETLRARLMLLLERPGASVEELIRVERELARLQGDIEGSEARIRALRARVSMSSLTLGYASRTAPVTRSAFSPIDRALRNLAGDFSRGLANVLSFLAGFLPWLIIIVPAGWLGLRGVSALIRRIKKTPAG